jgi:hypothetical protein
MSKAETKRTTKKRPARARLTDEQRWELQRKGEAEALRLVDQIVGHALEWNGSSDLDAADRIRFIILRSGRDMSDGLLWRLVDVIAATCTHATTATFRARDAEKAKRLRLAEEAEHKRDEARREIERAEREARRKAEKAQNSAGAR